MNRSVFGYLGEGKRPVDFKINDVDNFSSRFAKHAIIMSTSHIFGDCRIDFFVCFAQFTINIKLKLQSSLSTEIDLFDDSDKE